MTTLVGDRQVATGEKTETEIKRTQAAKEKAETGSETETEKTVGTAKETEVQEKAEVETATETRNIETEQKTVERVPVVVEIPEIRLIDGKVTFIDDTQEQSFQTTLDGLNFVARQVTIDATKPITLEVSCKSDAGEVIQQTGTVVREPLKAEGTVSLQQVLINRYVPYYARHLLFDIEEGKLDVTTQYAYAKGPENSQSTTLSGLAVTLNALRLRKRREKKDFLNIPTLSLKEAAIDVEKQTVTVGEVVTNKGSLQLGREKDGTLSLASLTPSTTVPEKNCHLFRVK